MEILKSWLPLLLLAVSVPAAATQSSVLLGHNLTPTTYGLSKGGVTAGTYALAYGLSDQWTIATSPWLIVNYNMATVITRITTAPGEQLPRAALEVSYFKTIPMLWNRYTQESLFIRATGSFSLGPSHVMHLSAGYQYFFDYARPFSLRLVPPWDTETPQTLSASTLQEIHLSDHLGVFLEAGLLGVNYLHPYLHLGASFFWKWDWGLLQAGLSRSSLMTSAVDYGYYNRVWHPELQFQTYL
jgi:hypothetical protein